MVTVDQSKPYTITGAPRVVHGRIVIGNGGAEYGVRGYVSAYDAASGKLAWRFYTVPGDPAKGPDHAASDPVIARAARATWFGDFAKAGGGGTVWDAIVYDPELDQLYIGVGNGSPWNQQVRSEGKGDNLFLSSVVALDARTGAYKWHYQGHARRDVGLHPDAADRPRRPDDRRPAAQGPDAGPQERLFSTSSTGRPES